MRSDVDDVAAVDMAATEDNSVGKGINDVMASTALIYDRVYDSFILNNSSTFHFGGLCFTSLLSYGASIKRQSSHIHHLIRSWQSLLNALVWA